METVRSLTTTATTPRRRGVELGRARADEVRRAAERYAALFARRGEPGFDATAWAARFREAIGDLAPASLTEISGIAEGAGVEELAVVAVNARTEILAKADPFGERELTTECSAVLVLPDDAPAFGVQTWDWYAAMADGWFRWRFPDPDGGWVETVTEHGLLAKIGVSSRGVGVLLNILHHRSDANDDVGLPVHLLARRILDTCSTYDEAEALCRETPVAASTSLTVVDRDSGGTLELFPGGPGVLRPRDGLLVRTNHFLSDAGRAGCLTRESYPTSTIRFDRLDTVLREEPPRSAADVVRAMDHHDPQGGVCRHPDPDLDPSLGVATLATVAVEPGVPGLQVLAGGPCGRAEDSWSAAGVADGGLLLG